VSALVDENDLVVGDTYTAIWDDCCAAGTFTSRLVEKNDKLVFANGVTLDAMGYGTQFTKVEDP
jgi:hypothetical protein